MARTQVNGIAIEYETFGDRGGRPLLLIMGGRDKGGDFRALTELISSRVKEVVVIGEASARRTIGDGLPGRII